MRSSYLLFVLATLCVTALIYQTTRPRKLDPATQRLIREAVAEAFQSHQASPEAMARQTEDLKEEIRRAVREAIAEATKTVPAHPETPPPGADALRAADLEAERRHEKQKKANADALVVDAVRIASDVQAWKLKPAPFGGGAEHDGFAGLRFEQIGYQENEANAYTNLNGVYQLFPEEATVRVVGTNAEFKNKVVVTVRGTRPGDITTSVQNLDAGS